MTPASIDFSAVYDGDNNQGVLITELLDRQKYVIAYDIFSIFDHKSTICLIESLLLFIRWYMLLCSILDFLLNGKRKQRLMIRYWNGMWPVFCTSIHQAVPSEVPKTRSHRILILTMRIAIALLWYVAASGTRKELVSYNPPRLINPLYGMMISCINPMSNQRIKPRSMDTN